TPGLAHQRVPGVGENTVVELRYRHRAGECRQLEGSAIAVDVRQRSPFVALIAPIDLHATFILCRDDIGFERTEALKVATLVALVVALAAWRQHLDHDDRIHRRLLVVCGVLGRAADDRSVAVTTARRCSDPESLARRVVPARAAQSCPA